MRTVNNSNEVHALIQNVKKVKNYYMRKNYFEFKLHFFKKDARNGDRTHAHIRELDLKSNALTTRPSGLIP